MTLNQLAQSVYEDPCFKQYHSWVTQEIILAEIKNYFTKKKPAKTETGQDILYTAFSICEVDQWEAIA